MESDANDTSSASELPSAPITDSAAAPSAQNEATGTSGFFPTLGTPPVEEPEPRPPFSRSHGQAFENITTQYENIRDRCYELSMTLGESDKAKAFIERGRKLDEQDAAVDSDPFAEPPPLQPFEEDPNRMRAEDLATNTLAAKPRNLQNDANNVMRRLGLEISALNHRFGLSGEQPDTRLQHAIDTLLDAREGNANAKSHSGDKLLDAKAEAYVGELNAAYAGASNKMGSIAERIEREIEKYKNPPEHATPRELQGNEHTRYHSEGAAHIERPQVPQMASQSTPYSGRA